MMRFMIINKDENISHNDVKSDSEKIKWYPKSKKLT
jgi:hypothetical protein